MPLRPSEIQHILRHFGVADYEIEVVDEVLGFQGTYYHLKIGERSTYFVKAVPEGSGVVDDFYKRSGTFAKEVALYTEILPRLEPLKLGKLWPTCHVGAAGRYLVLEEMKEAGWEVAGKMDFEHLKTALHGLADFHATSLAANDPDFVRKMISILDETMFSADESRPGRQMWDSFCRIADEILPGRGIFEILQNVVDRVRPSKAFHNCMNHGDPWTNNMFFKYRRGRPVDVVFVDFQSARYAPPALDVAIFAHIFAPENPDESARIYWERLKNTQKLRGSPPILTEDEFRRSFAHYKSTGVGVAALYTFLTRLPRQYLSEVLVSQDAFIPFALGSDYSPALKALAEDSEYREAVFAALQRVHSSNNVS